MSSTTTSPPPPSPSAGDHPRVLLRGFLSHETCKELEFVHRSCGAAGYRPLVLSTSLPHLAATSCGHLLLPFVPVRERLRDAVESFFDCQFDLFIEFTGLISWCKGASIGWHSDDSKPYLRQRAFTTAFRKTSGSHNFVADFPAADDDVVFGTEFDDGGCSPDADASRCVKRARPQARNKTLKYKLFASTWNVGGVAPPDDLDLSDWLDGGDDGPYDMYVLGFQEVVPLRARNVLGADEKRVGMRWIELIRAALNRSRSHSQQSSSGGGGGGDGGGKQQKVHPVRDGGGGELAREYRCVVSKQMVGILLTVWVRSDLRRFVRRPSVSCVGCGVMGCLGNKGAVSVRFWLHDTSFCFVCCHLASGGREGDEAHRNADATEILSRTTFPRGHALNLPLPHKILDHDRVILLGDLNYRISLPEAKTRPLVERQDWKTLLENDQLRAELVCRGGAFQGWSEGAITFSPTYKYYPNSDAYYGCGGHSRSNKRRAPAWCDRILWRGAGLRQTRYGRCESRLSDHRPVRAIFTVEVDAPRNLNSLRSFFMSERFDRARGRSLAADQLLRKDDVVNSARFADTL